MKDSLTHIADIPAHIFGSESTLAQSAPEALLHPEAVLLPEDHPTIGLWFMISVVALGALYMLWLNYWSSRSDNHRALFRFLGFHRGDLADKCSEFGRSFSLYLWSGAGLGLTSIWMAITVICGFSTGDYRRSVLTAASLLAVYLYQIIVILTMRLLLSNSSFTKLLLHLKGISFSITALVLIPTILCYSLSQGVVQSVFSYIVIIQFIMAMLLFLFETFILFLSKKVSLLHTILYLCAVEIFPVTLIWGFFCR